MNTSALDAPGGLFEHLEARKLLASSITFEHLLETIEGVLDPVASIEAADLGGSSGGFGISLLATGDLDGDGVGDFAVGSSGAADASLFLGFATGRVDVFSGATRELLYTLSDGSFEFGVAMVTAGDVNGDGVPDIVVGSPRAFIPMNAPQDEGDLETSLVVPGPGRVHIYSGVDGAPIRELDGATDFGDYGRALAVLRDLNGDGVPEIAIGSPGGGPESEGIVEIVDPVTGEVYSVLTGENTLDRFGASVSVNHAGDGVLLVGAPGNDEAGADAGKVYVYTGVDDGGTTRIELDFTLLGEGEQQAYGSSVASFRADGSGRIAVGAPGYYSEFDPIDERRTTGRIYVFDQFGSEHRSFIGDVFGGGTRLGAALHTLPPLREGGSDWLVGITGDGSPAYFIDGSQRFGRLGLLPRTLDEAPVEARRTHLLPTAIAAIDDLDGDGTRELVTADVARGLVNVSNGLLVDMAGPILGASGDGTFLWTATHIVGGGRISTIETHTGLDGLEIADINNLGEILATRRIGEDSEVIVIRAGTSEVIPTDALPEGVIPRRLADSGTIVFAGLPRNSAPLLVFDDGGFIDLGHAVFTDINASGTLVGYLGTGPGIHETITWSPGDGALTVIEGFFDAGAINDDGVILGLAQFWVFSLWDDGVITRLGTPNSVAPSTPFSGMRLHDLNNRNELTVTFSIFQTRTVPHPANAFGGAGAFHMLSRVSSSNVPFWSLPERIFDDGRMLVEHGFLRPIAPDEHLAIDPGVVPSGSSGDGQITFAGVDEFGDPVFFRLDASAQRATFTNPAETALPEFGNFHIDGVVSWVDPVDGRARIFTTGRVFTLHDDGTWSARSIPGPFGRDIASGFTVMRTPRNTIMIAGLRFNGELVHYFQTGERDENGDPIWRTSNLSREHFRLQDRPEPRFVGNVVAYSTPWNSRHIVGIDENGDLRGVWWAPGLNSPFWTTTNLSDATGAPALVGGVTAFVTPDGQINIAGSDDAGNLHRVSWQPGSPWHHENLSELVAPDEGLPVLIGTGSVTGYVTAWGGVNFFGIGSGSGVPVSFFLPAGETSWRTFDMGEQIEDPLPAVTGALTGVTGPGLGHNVFATTDEGEVLLFKWRRGDASWSMVPVRELIV